jgi:serine/threonine-protein kinase SRPK3
MYMQIFSLIFGALPDCYPGASNDDTLVANIIDFVGEFKLEEEWQPKWERMRLSSNKHTVEELENRGDRPSQMEEVFARGSHGHASLLPIIRALMRFLPSSRITASEALDLLTRT